MRQANVYLNELRDDCHKQGARDTDSKINQMQLYLQFVPNWNVDQTFAKLLNDASYVDDLLKGHWQDWEAVVTEVVSEIGQIVTDVKELRRNSILNYFF